MAAPALHAEQIPGPPKWVPYEMKAINLCLAGMSQESSDPQRALNTLRQAREESNAAIADGGGANWVVWHNDQVIARATMLAEADAARTPDTNKATPAQKSAGINLARPGSNHLQATINIRRAVK